jgi:hypothetical protein
MLKIGISSISRGIKSPPISMPFKREELIVTKLQLFFRAVLSSSISFEHPFSLGHLVFLSA